ncbi:hypothetical protein P3T76_014305 [Phytophthora citrophthora]|uniref:Uncharacterized protein n=1 Tax=Phytophthora citrophthora TaxID=4793 RepID=A0AAD9G1I9_9STRA|nr:hypothetical protein P3T76_014305 [Phytophthora citrophthora]
MTGGDLWESGILVGRDHLDKLRERSADAQQIMSKIKEIHSHRSGMQGEMFARTERILGL